MSFEDLMGTPKPSVQIHRPLASRAECDQGILQPSITQATKKRASATKKPQAKKTKASTIVDLEGDGGEASENSSWQDSWIRELIGFRQEMDQYFEQNAKKQGANTWDKLQCKMVVACKGFTKTVKQC
jgi:hypothetical protein